MLYLWFVHLSMFVQGHKAIGHMYDSVLDAHEGWAPCMVLDTEINKQQQRTN